MTLRPTRLVVAALVVAAFSFVTPRASADFLHDDFNNPASAELYIITYKNANPYSSGPTTVSTGVSRAISVLVTAPPTPTDISASGYVGGGQFSMATDQVSKATATITYTLTGAARNLTGASAIDLAFSKIDGGTGLTNTPVTVTLNTTGGTLTGTAFIPDSNTSSVTSFLLGSFTSTGAPSLSQVNSIVITLNATTSQPSHTAVDLALDGVKVRGVPAPPAVLLAGFGVLALVGRARLTRKPTVA